MEKESLEWDEIYSVNIDKFDLHHKKLIAIINELDQLIREDFTEKELEKISKELYEYADFHFLAEEEMMEKYQFPETEDHKKLHRYYLNKINELKPDKKAKENGIELLSFLFDWLVSHIINEDKKYTKYFIRED